MILQVYIDEASVLKTPASWQFRIAASGSFRSNMNHQCTYWLLARDNGQGFEKGFLTLDLFLTCVLHATPWCLCLKCVVDLLILPGLHDGHIGSLKIVDRFGSGVSKTKNQLHIFGVPFENLESDGKKGFFETNPTPPPPTPQEGAKQNR